ncbi:MAG: 2,3-butanediol dehydrogenase [Deltaproteobacteria bacterium]|jgi:(R,R)-butanediol dehydrogenase / meso-butanediol dehydrogenase / diacetyl reductase|nr:2,3-butanediol dehydrogenase [Deltaproteobacteria bacterium]MBT4638459.1 2,3-butanediol dehydrogenase [Deltaproteobacteria bacterium]MBT6503919.1 2,3-butanediol dehydrogenase [Deltaproteobacteria bacterium]MBT6611088.1 2,3-butanediol dehydrogenase [Deltaproteobacteria bacterium]MBT7154355.1 2,3-butanediol dehydrogenase [Deltaproteobacteria bacterium]
MKAAVWYKKGDIRIEEIPEPKPATGQIKVRVKTCGICGSDLHEYNAGPFLIPAKPHPLTNRMGGPVVIGHEFSAEVVELGQGVKNFKLGDRVTMNALILCGECHYCRQGAYNMCVKLGSKGFADDGGFAEYAVLDEYSAYKLPDTVSDDMGSFVEPLAVAVRAVKRSRLVIGDSVVVVGAGPIGLLVMQVCLTAGASKVFVVEPLKKRRELAKKLGANLVFDPAAVDPGKEIAKITEGLRADIAFDCVGNQSAFNTALKVTGRRGVICVAGLALKPIEVPFIKLWGHEKELTFSSGYENEFPAAIALLANGKIDIDSMVSTRIKLDDLVEKGIKPLVNDGGKYVKILVDI